VGSPRNFPPGRAPSTQLNFSALKERLLLTYDVFSRAR
jgi:hypothetical protein